MALLFANLTMAGLTMTSACSQRLIWFDLYCFSAGFPDTPVLSPSSCMVTYLVVLEKKHFLEYWSNMFFCFLQYVLLLSYSRRHLHLSSLDKGDFLGWYLLLVVVMVVASTACMVVLPAITGFSESYWAAGPNVLDLSSTREKSIGWWHITSSGSGRGK